MESKTRPLKLVLDSKAQRKFLLDNARFVQTKADDNYKRVIITKDLTPAQREERREKIAKIRAQRRSNQSSSRNTSPKHSAASMEVDRPLPSPIRPNQQAVPRLLLSQGNPLNDSLNSEHSVREPSFMYNRTTVINDTTLTGDRTVMGVLNLIYTNLIGHNLANLLTPRIGILILPVNLRNQSFNVNNSILHANVSDSLSILYSNVDCLTQSKKLELEYLLSNKKVDIVALTELYPQNSLFENLDSFYHLQDYDSFLGSTNQGREVGIFVKTELCADSVLIETDFQESVWCSVNLRHNDSLLIGCLYRSPNCFDDNCRKLYQIFDDVKNMRQSHKLIMGDFNFRDINWSDMTTASNEQHNSTLFIESIRDSFLFQHVIKPTRIRENNEPSILDLIFTNEEEMVSDIQYESSLGKSDHLILSFKFNNYSDLNSKDNKCTRQTFFKGDYQSILGQLELINWDGEMDGLDLSGSWAWFTELYIDLLEKYMPESMPRQNLGN